MRCHPRYRPVTSPMETVEPLRFHSNGETDARIEALEKLTALTNQLSTTGDAQIAVQKFALRQCAPYLYHWPALRCLHRRTCLENDAGLLSL